MFFHLKIMLRNLRHGGIYSAINIGGLSVGMAAAALLLLWVYNQWSYDRFHPKAEQIYQVWSRSADEGQISCWNATSMMIGPALKDQYPEIVESVRVAHKQNYFFGEGDRHLSIGAMHADPSFLTVFSFPLLQGDVHTALNDPYSIILTEKAVQRLFGDEDPMGKTLMFDMKHPVTVTGVMKDLPGNTRFDFEILGALQFLENVLKTRIASWGNFTLQTYVELTPHADLEKLNDAIRDIINKNADYLHTEAFLYPLDKSYLQANFENGVPSGGLITFLRMFAIVAGFILLIACINYVNLSTARSSLRAKEVGVRKALGSRKLGLIGLFLSESLVVTFISGIIAFTLVFAVMPDFSSWLGGFFGKTLFVDLLDFRFWLFALSFILFTGIVAGAYPAFILSAFRPVKVLKGNVVNVGASRVTLRKVLVVLQFFIATFLIIGTLAVRLQINHLKNRNAGYDKELLVHIPLPEGITNHYTAFRNDLMASGAVKDMTRAWANMIQMWASTWSPHWSGKDPEDRRSYNLFFADGNWAEMMGAELVAGRFPDAATFPTDSSAIIINETAAQMIGLDDPIGVRLDYWGYEGQITTVIKDFVLHSPFQKSEPMVVGCEKLGGARTRVYIRLSVGKTADRLASVERIFKQYSAGYPFEYKFVDEELAATINPLRSVEKLTGLFTTIAILISCLGLYALTALTVERRRKEIGIRKVLGASVSSIVWLISKEYIILTIIAFAIAAPLAWIVMNQALNMFPYRTNIPVWLIVAVGALILVIALATVGYQAIKAATANPVKAIKSE